MTHAKETHLNFIRILTFAGVLLVLRVGASFLVASPEQNDEPNAQIILWYLIGYLLDSAIVIAVIAKLAKVQVHSTYFHAFCVVVLQELLSAAIVFAIAGSHAASSLWLLDFIVLILSVVIGVTVGRRMRKGNPATP